MNCQLKNVLEFKDFDDFLMYFMVGMEIYFCNVRRFVMNDNDVIIYIKIGSQYSYIKLKIDVV